MTKSKIADHPERVENARPDAKEELMVSHELLVGLRFHIEAQYLLSSQKTKQRIIVWIVAVAALLTVIFSTLQ